MRRVVLRAVVLVCMALPVFAGQAWADSPIDPAIMERANKAIDASWKGVWSAFEEAKTASSFKEQSAAAKKVYAALEKYEEELTSHTRTKGLDQKELTERIAEVKKLREAGYVTKDGVGTKLAIDRKRGLVASWTSFENPLVGLAPDSMTLTR